MAAANQQASAMPMIWMKAMPEIDVIRFCETFRATLSRLTNANADQNRSIWGDSIVNLVDATLLQSKKNVKLRAIERSTCSTLPDTCDPCTKERHSGSSWSLDRCIAVGSNSLECPKPCRCWCRTNFSVHRFRSTSFSSEWCPKPSCLPAICFVSLTSCTQFIASTWPTLFWRPIDFDSWVFKMSRKSFLNVIAAMPTATSRMKIIPSSTAN